jgi:CIC family chloride channel protein
MIGGALGGVEAMFFPKVGVGFWPLVSMGGILGGTMRAPFTGVIFMVELTHDYNSMLPLLITAAIAHACTVLMLKRSILTEKIARRGFHLSREYSVDPLEILFVREVMRTTVVALPDGLSPREMHQMLQRSRQRPQRIYPIVDGEHRLVGVVTPKDLDKIITDPVVAYPDEPLRAVVYRMAETGRTRLPVVDRHDRHKLVGLISLSNLLHARTRDLEEERHRERVLRMRIPFVSRTKVQAETR